MQELTPATIKSEPKTSSLRSVRVKSERMKDTSNKTDKQQVANSISENAATPKSEIKEEPIEGTTTTLTSCAASNVEVKASEPVTAAVAPIQKTSPDQSLSPVEGKENIPVSNASDPVEAKNSESDDVIEVPYKPKSPEIIDLESDTYKTITSNNNNLLNNNILQEVKKRKLDILKEGGLEVTPVTNASPVSEMRPTVIQQNLPPVQIGSVTVATDKKFMPPPSINATLIKKPVTPVSSKVSANNAIIKPKPSPTNVGYSYINGTSPPKVVQSKSIYSPSDRTVYGDPKDCFTPSIHAVQTPKTVNSNFKHNGGDILDLTVKSPQKPALEITQIPTMQMLNSNYNNSSSIRDKCKKPQIPLFDGRRVGSNLEITLVGPSIDKNSPSSLINNGSSRHRSISMHQPSNYYSNSHKQPKKRTLSDTYTTSSKQPRLGENVSRQMNPLMYSHMTHRDKQHVNNQEMNVPNPYMSRSSNEKVEASFNRMNNNNSTKHHANNTQMHNSKHYNNATMPQVYPNYLPQLPNTVNKTLNPYNMPILDPFYCSAFQNLYNSNPAVPPLLQLPTPEQLQFYTDLITHNSRVRFPFPFTQEGSNSPYTSSNLNNIKKQ